MILARERIRYFSVLGIRFWDQATESQVSDSLEVTARPEANNGSDIERAVVHAVRNGSGIYAFHNLPGMRDWEIRGDDDASYDRPRDLENATRRPFVIQASDKKGRFIPVARRVELPLPQRGLFLSSSLASIPGSAPPGFYLFSAATRPTPAGMAVIRAHMVEAFVEEPAAHAVLLADVDGQRRYGVADEHGRVALVFPYPQVQTPLADSFPAGRTPFSEQQWDIKISVFRSQTSLPLLPGTKLPDLREVLHQCEGEIYAIRGDLSTPATPSNALTVTIQYGRETVVRTQGSSYLWIRPSVGSLP